MSHCSFLSDRTINDNDDDVVPQNHSAPVRQPKAEGSSPSKSGTYGCKHLLSDSESSDEDVDADSRVTPRPSTSVPEAKRRKLGAPDAKVGSSSHRQNRQSPITPTRFDPSGARLSLSKQVAPLRRERERGPRKSTSVLKIPRT